MHFYRRGELEKSNSITTDEVVELSDYLLKTLHHKSVVSLSTASLNLNSDETKDGSRQQL